MKITSLVENTSGCGMDTRHGLSLLIETRAHKILFDLGPDRTLFSNAEKLKNDLRDVDIVVISHGHSDHGGALKQFLELNNAAKVYIQRNAFEPHYSKVMLAKVPISLDKKLADSPQVVLVDGNYEIDDELLLFKPGADAVFCSAANKALLCSSGQDDFSHEQNLLLRGKTEVVVMGCGHRGVMNIMSAPEARNASYCIGGFHVYNPVSRKTNPESELRTVKDFIESVPGVRFYTCHCTGRKAYRFLSEGNENVRYLSCGDSLVIDG